MTQSETPRTPIITVGRRKEATARVYCYTQGKGNIIINGRNLDQYFTTSAQKILVREPLMKGGCEATLDIKAKVEGGGITGQAGAIRLGIARAIILMKPELRSLFGKEKLLTRDQRSKERKKFGQKGARKKVQWTKR